jgi:hypothetical protein
MRLLVCCGVVCSSCSNWLGLAPLPGVAPSSASCDGAAAFPTDMRVVGLLRGRVRLMLLLVGARHRYPALSQVRQAATGGCVPHRMRVVGLLRGRVRLMLLLVGARSATRRCPKFGKLRRGAAFPTE